MPRDGRLRCENFCDFRTAAKSLTGKGKVKLPRDFLQLYVPLSVYPADQALVSQNPCSLRPREVRSVPVLVLQWLAGLGQADSVSARNCVPGTGLKLTGAAGTNPSERYRACADVNSGSTSRHTRW